MENSEESGWTMYFEDFFSKKENHGVDDDPTQDEEEHSFCISSDFDFHESSSMVSDAASLAAAGKLAASAGDQQKRLSYKKRRKIKGANFVDYDLEDTASSPANSLKVCNLLNHNKDAINQDGTMNPSQVRQEKLVLRNGTSRLEEINHEVRLRERDDSDDNNDGGMKLKKRGLCLVPLSMVVSFLG